MYCCPVEGCHFSGHSSSHLRLHSVIHSEDKPFICLINECNQKFKINEKLRSHQLKAHPLEMEDFPWIECTEEGCNYKTKLTYNYTTHIAQHSRPYVCTQCQKSFISTIGLNLSFENTFIWTEDPVRVVWMRTTLLYQPNRMRDHMNSHTLEKSHSCHWPECDKTYTTLLALRSHIYSHEGKGVYRCSDCEWRGKNPIRFRNHRKRHENQTKVSEKWIIY